VESAALCGPAEVHGQGARYLSAKTGRFTTVDPAITLSDNLVDPQRWNRYVYGRNNPLRYIDPDGREIYYADAALKQLFGFLASRSDTARATLELFVGSGKPDLFVVKGSAGKDADGTPAIGRFAPSGFNVSYAGKESQLTPDKTSQQLQDLGTWTLTGGTITLDTSLRMSTSDRLTVTTALHELGHADQAARNPLQYQRDSPTRRPDGREISHDARPAEVYANKYQEKTTKEVRP
jgi:RHS repeat-associated protein